MTMMGGPIDARKSPTAVNNLAMNKSHSWFENNVIYRVPSSFPGVGRRVYPGFLQHTGFVAMNPDNHAKSHYDYFQDLIKGDDASTEAHRKFYDEYNAVLDMDADYYLETIRSCSRTSAWSTAPGMCGRGRQARARAPAGHQDHGAVHGGRRTGRHLGFRPDRGRARPVQRRAQGAPEALEVKGAGHYGIFRAAAGARCVPAGQGLHPGAQRNP
jgi:poly(3-hydroxybutyrate) depolymerase